MNVVSFHDSRPRRRKLAARAANLVALDRAGMFTEANKLLAEYNAPPQNGGRIIPFERKSA